ncbi:MAG: class I SAM-dependent methyltransferase [Actinomycetota bacterium]
MNGLDQGEDEGTSDDGGVRAALVSLPAAPGAEAHEPFAGADHPMRQLTRASAAGEPFGTEQSARVQQVFDAMAASWSEDHVDKVKAAPVADALERGDVPLDGDWLEVGSGTGAGARVLHGRVGSLVCTDLAMEMLRHAPDLAPRLRSDASRLPFTKNRFDAVLLINMLLFPDEVDRVLRADGVVVWVNTLGDQTPIHLPPHDVLAALPGSWTGVTAAAGTGFWLVARRR